MKALSILCLTLMSGCNSPDSKIEPQSHLPIPAKLEYKPKTTLTDFIVIPTLHPDLVSAVELNQVDSLLKACVAEFNRAAEADYADMHKTHSEIPFRKENYVIDLSAYKKQLVVSVNSKGVKTVWVNCFCSDEADFPNWKREIVDITDGGNCFFNVRLNLTEGTWEDLQANGVA
ncbi:hypothetical protein [Hymenobacter lucidus]|uniref:Lipoprotein n=1 Tax=Hymenobacter lucidus TaxID=2880930 RepID=A0ABS8AWJ8_9BACT|nr:hypothetical protein [Hymenobacter lucidus]MCB2410185.1 hypothetical protein [Hymenobacter lucidus]